MNHGFLPGIPFILCATLFAGAVFAESAVERSKDASGILTAIGYSSKLPAGFEMSPASIKVADSLPFKEQVQKHAEILQNLNLALQDSQDRKALARENSAKNGMFEQYLAAEEDEKNAIKFLAPYAVAQGIAQVKKNEGYKLTNVAGTGDWSGSACNGAGACGDVDPIVALLMMLIDSVNDEFNKEKPFGPNNELTKLFIAVSGFVDRPLGGPNSDLVKIREAMLGHDQNGELARLIRDPIKRPVQIVQDLRDKIIPASDNGEIAKAIRDPIKCTIGHLWGGCN